MARFLTILGVLRRALVDRRLLSAACLVVAVVAVAAGALGPMYVASAGSSLLLTRLDAAENRDVGLSWRFVPDASEHLSAEAATAAAVDATDREVDVGGYEPPLATLQSRAIGIGRPFSADIDPETAACSHLDIDGRCLEFTDRSYVVVSRAGQCRHLVIRGRCPARTGETLVADIDVGRGGFAVGTTISLGPDAPDLEVVGTYRLSDPSDDYWFDATSYQSTAAQPGRINPVSYSPAPFFVVPAQVTALPSGYVVRVDRALVVDTGLESRLPALSRLSARVTRKADITVEHGVLHPSPDSQLTTIVRVVVEERRTARATVIPAVLSLAMVCLVILFRLFGAAGDVRRPEIALAKLRGCGRRQLWGFGLAEPLALLALALAGGLLVAVPANKLVTGWWLRQDTPYGLNRSAVLVAVGVFAGAVGAAAIAMRRVLQEAIHDQLEPTARPVRTRRAVRVVQVLVVASAAAGTASMLLAKETRAPRLIDQAAPALIGFAVALLSAAGATLLARQLVRITARRRALAPFLQARALALRREGVLMVVPITVALALAVFSTGTWIASQHWRDSVAAYEVGAPVSYATQLNAVSAQSLTARLDPQGRWLMATAVQQNTFPSSVFVDTSRLAAVGVWPASWLGGESLTRTIERLRPAFDVPRIEGRSLALTVDSQVEADQGLSVTVSALAADGRTRSVSLGPFPRGRATRAAPVDGCMQGCTLTDFVVGGVAGVPLAARGSLHVQDLTVDGATVDAAFDRGPTGWHVANPVRGSDQDLKAAVGPASATGLSLSIDSGGGAGAARFVTGAAHSSFPVVLGRETTRVLAPGGAGGVVAVAGLDGSEQRAHVVATSEALPILGTTGAMGDLTTFTDGGFDATAPLRVRVLARADVPAAMIAQLRAAGVDTDRPQRLSAAQRVVDQDAYALSLRLYLVVAAAVVLLAAAGAVAGIGVQLRSRQLDAAALRVIGVTPATLARAATLEFVTVFAIAAGAGVLAGVLAQQAVLRSVRLGSGGPFAPRVLPSVDVGTLTAITALVALALVVLSSIAAWSIVRRARGAALRQS